MHQTPPKRQQMIQRTLVYSSMTTFVLLLVAILVFLMLGYRFNQTSNTIEQGGLVQFSSRPTNAQVKIGSANITDTTPSKITVNPGDYTASMNKANYQSWQKDVTVRAGEVLWLNYAWLVPNNLTTDAVTMYPSLAQAVASPSGQYIATLNSKNTQSFMSTKIDNDTTEQKRLTLPSTLLSADSSAEYAIVRWSDTNNRILATRTMKGKKEWFVINRAEPTKSYAITSDYDVDVADAIFDPRSDNRLFIQTASGDIRILDSTQKSLSAVLVKNVIEMSLADERAVLYVQRPTKKETVFGYLTLDRTEGRELTRTTSTAVSRVAAGTYFGDIHVAVTTGDVMTIYKLDQLPSSDSEVSLTMTDVAKVQLPGIAQFLSVRSNGRFVVAQSPRGFTTYDLELKKYATTDVAIPLKAELDWFDYYHPYYAVNKTLQVLEFDGANRHAITTVVPDFDAVQTDNGTYIYSFNRNTDGYLLQRTRMILK